MIVRVSVVLKRTVVVDNDLIELLLFTTLYKFVLAIKSVDKIL